MADVGEATKQTMHETAAWRTSWEREVRRIGSARARVRTWKSSVRASSRRWEKQRARSHRTSPFHVHTHITSRFADATHDVAACRASSASRAPAAEASSQPFHNRWNGPIPVAFAPQDRRSPSLSPFSLSRPVFEPMFLMGGDAGSKGKWKGTCFLSKGRERDTNRPRPWPTKTRTADRRTRARVCDVFHGRMARSRSMVDGSCESSRCAVETEPKEGAMATRRGPRRGLTDGMPNQG